MKHTFENAADLARLADLHMEGIRRMRNMWLDEKCIFYGEEFPEHLTKESRSDNVLFMAGPTTRDGIPDYMSRKDGHFFLRRGGYRGYIIIPQYRGESYLSSERFDFSNSEAIVRWEGLGLKISNIKMFWVPRNEEQLKGATTNHEVSKWLGKAEHKKSLNDSLFIGWSDDATHMTWLATEMKDGELGKLKGDHFRTQEDLCKAITDIYQDMDDDIPF